MVLRRVAFLAAFLVLTIACRAADGPITATGGATASTARATAPSPGSSDPTIAPTAASSSVQPPDSAPTTTATSVTATPPSGTFEPQTATEDAPPAGEPDPAPTDPAPTDTSPPETDPPATGGTAPPGPAPQGQLGLQIVATYPHDPGAFTQGLELHGGWLYESTGLHGRSSVRQVEVSTGAVVASRDLDPSLFGEGLTRVGNQLVQITWRNGVGLRWDLDTLQPRGSFSYEGEGWGLCDDGSRLVQSNGSDQLLFRHRDTFELQGSVTVHDGATAVSRLNELECVGDVVYANIWYSDLIARIDPATGAVTGWVDASALRAGQSDILNGIAYDPADGTFLLTGKLWTTVYRVRIG